MKGFFGRGDVIILVMKRVVEGVQVTEKTKL
jgi:hypothetical protein